MWLTKEKRIELNGISINCFSADFKNTGLSLGASSVGIDPGKEFGITWVNRELDEILVYNGTMPDGKHEKYGIFAFDLIQEFFHYQCLFYDDLAIIEGAAYGSTFGQVGLAEIRFGFYLGLQKMMMAPEIVPPASIRKKVFGSAKIHAGELWPVLNHNAATSTHPQILNKVL
jgi:hypothetical protein